MGLVGVFTKVILINMILQIFALLLIYIWAAKVSEVADVSKEEEQQGEEMVGNEK